MLIKKWNSLSLIVRICIGLVIGAVLGLLLPGWKWIAVLGTLFVGALKAIAPLLVFVLVASSLANAKGGNMSKFSKKERANIARVRKEMKQTTEYKDLLKLKEKFKI